jgi:hypothetical protein
MWTYGAESGQYILCSISHGHPNITFLFFTGLNNEDTSMLDGELGKNFASGILHGILIELPPPTFCFIEVDM